MPTDAQPIYFVRDAHDSLWRRSDGDPTLPPDQVLTPGGAWRVIPPLDAETWLTAMIVVSAEEARQIASRFFSAEL